MSTGQGQAGRPKAAASLRRLTSSYLLQFLVFVAVLLLVVVLLARQPQDCACDAETAQIVLLALGGMVALVGTVLLAVGDNARARTAVVLIGAGVVLVAAAGLVGFW